MVLQTRHETPFESTNSRLAMYAVTSKDSARSQELLVAQCGEIPNAE